MIREATARRLSSPPRRFRSGMAVRDRGKSSPARSHRETAVVLSLALFSVSAWAQVRSQSSGQSIARARLAVDLGAPSGPFFLVLLNRPAKAPRPSDEANARLQAEHAANIRKLFAQHKLAMAGPLLDDTALNAISVFQTGSMVQAQEWADSDPMIKAGQLTDEVHGPWLVDARAIQHPAAPAGVDQYTLVVMNRDILSTGAPDFAEMMRQYAPFVRRMTEDGKLAAAGLIDPIDTGQLRGVAIYRVDVKEAAELEQSDPIYKAGMVRIEIHPWITARGVLAPGRPPEGQLMSP